MNNYIVVLITLFFSALFSGAEIAYISSNKLRLDLDYKRGKFAARIIQIFIKNQDYFITTMLVGNNLSLVIYGIAMALILEPILYMIYDQSAFVFIVQTIVSTGLILFTAEFMPKSLFRLNPNGMLSFLAVPLLIFYIILYPITLFIALISNALLKYIFKLEVQEAKQQVFNTIDLTELISPNDQAKSSENINSELKMFRNTLELSKIKLRDCMTPRPEICAVSIDASIEDLRERFIETNFSKIIVYKQTIDDALGYIHCKNIFNRDKSLKELVKKVDFYPETYPANKLLGNFIDDKKSTAIVVDEFGVTSGMVTIEDLIEEIFGEIEDEHDEIELVEQKLSDDTYLLSGRFEIDLINEKYGINIPESEEYETLAGYILWKEGSLPSVGTILLIDHFKIETLKVSKTKLELVKISVLNTDDF